MQNAVLKARAGAILKRDEHALEDGCYRVRSLYFDSAGDRCYYENENGVGERDKYRIRIYNADPENIFLEKKSKRRQMIRKRSCRIDEETCRSLMCGKTVRITSGMEEEQQELLLQLQGNDLDSFLEEKIRRRPVLEKGMSVFEVKWDEFLPGYIKNHIQLDTLQWSSFSKYYLCRKYNTYGGIRI